MTLSVLCPLISVFCFLNAEPLDLDQRIKDQVQFQENTGGSSFGQSAWRMGHGVDQDAGSGVVRTAVLPKVIFTTLCAMPYAIKTL